LHDKWRLWSTCRIYAHGVPHVKSTSLLILDKLAAGVLRSGTGYNSRCGVVSDWARQPPGGKDKLHIKNMRKAMGNHLVLLFPRHDIDYSEQTTSNEFCHITSKYYD